MKTDPKPKLSMSALIATQNYYEAEAAKLAKQLRDIYYRTSAILDAKKELRFGADKK